MKLGNPKKEAEKAAAKEAKETKSEKARQVIRDNPKASLRELAVLTKAAGCGRGKDWLRVERFLIHGGSLTSAD